MSIHTLVKSTVLVLVSLALLLHYRGSALTTRIHTILSLLQKQILNLSFFSPFFLFNLPKINVIFTQAAVLLYIHVKCRVTANYKKETYYAYVA